MNKYAVLLGVCIVAILCTFSYFLGKKQAKVEIVTKEVEIIKYVEKEKAKIMARPNASRDELLVLMHNGKL